VKLDLAENPPSNTAIAPLPAWPRWGCPVKPYKSPVHRAAVLLARRDLRCRSQEAGQHDRPV